MRALLVAATAMTASGCFSYVPAELGALPEGNDVRVHLSRQGLADLPQVPDEAGGIVRGRLLENGPQGLLVRMPVGLAVGALTSKPIAQEIAIPVQHVVEVERRRFDGFRTGLTIAAGIAAAAAVVIGFSGGRSDQAPEIPDPPIEGIRIPLLSFPPR